MIRRYELVRKSVQGGYASVDEMELDDAGEWVRHDAHARAVAAAVAQEREQIRSLMHGLRFELEARPELPYHRGKAHGLDDALKAIDARAQRR